MDINNLLKICIKALLNNKTRCFLTMLGIIIGVAAVIAMLAIGNGSKQSIRAEIGQMGSNMIMVSPGNGQFGGVRQSGSSMQTLKLADYEAIVQQASYVDKITPTVQASGQAIKGSTPICFGNQPVYAGRKRIKWMRVPLQRCWLQM